MFEKEHTNHHHGKNILTLTFASVLLLSLSGIFLQNASAHGPSVCYNQYDAPFVSFMINNGTQTFDALDNPNLNFNANAYSSFNLTFVMHTPSLSSWGNSDPGAVWFNQNVNNFGEGACLGPVGPNQNITSSEVVGNIYPGIGWIQSITYGTAASMSVTFNVHWMSVSSFPQNLMVTASPSQINLSWSVPATNGGSPITNYNIYRGTASGTETLLTTLGNATSYNDTTVTNGQTYFYKVTAVNSVGESSPSNEASAMPLSTSGNKVIATIPVEGSPWNIAVNPDTNRIYVGTNGTEVIDGATNTIIAKIAGVSGAGVNPLTNKIYACGANTISVINGNTNQVDTIIPVGAHCGHLAVNPATNKIYVDSGANSFSVIDGNTNQVVKTVSISGHPYDIAVNPDTNRIYQTSWDTLLSGPIAYLSVIDGSTDTVLQSIALGINAGAVAVNPTTNMIYANNQYIYVINGSTNDVVNKIGGFHVGDYLGINKITNKIYVSDARSNTVSVIDGSNDTITSTIQVGNVPEGIGVNTNTSKIYVANFNDKTVSVIDGSSPTIPQSPTGLTATAKMPPQIDLSWTAPSDDGGSAITGYMIERSTDNGATWSILVQNTNDIKTAYTDSHLMPVKTYTYRVSAINSVGTSLPSNTASARPLSAHGHS